jgi:hypothetical protein
VTPPKSRSLRAARSKIRTGWSVELGSRVSACARRGAAGARQNVLAGRWPARFDTNGRSADRHTALNRRPRLKTLHLGLPTIGPIRHRPIRISSVTVSLPRIVPIGRAGTRVTSVTLTRRADGEWWVACTVERRLRPPRGPNERAGDAMVAQAREPKTAAAAGGLATRSPGRHEPSQARLFSHPQLMQAEQLSLPLTPYSQLAVNALTSSEDTPILAGLGSADGMARLRRTIGRLRRDLTRGFC